jgi:hypothetical protein
MFPISSVNNVKVKLIIADAPKRAELRKVQQHSGFYACDCCLKKATPYSLPGRTGSKCIWPYSKDDAEARTHQGTLETALNTTRLTYEERKGVIGHSELFRLLEFDVINQMLPEPMHLMCEGMCSHLVR